MVAGTEKGVLLGFAFSAWLATSPTSLAVRATWEGADVLGQVASDISVQPFFQGISEIPSSLLSSECAMPMGSRRQRIFAETSVLLRRSFTAACMSWVPNLTPPAAKAVQTQMVHFSAEHNIIQYEYLQNCKLDCSPRNHRSLKDIPLMQHEILLQYD